MKIATSQVVITGIKRFKGDVDGQQYDSCSVFVEMDLNEGENSKGSATAEFKIGKSTEYDKLKDYVLPMQAEVEISMTTNGKRTQQTMKVVRVLNQQPKKAA